MKKFLLLLLGLGLLYAAHVPQKVWAQARPGYLLNGRTSGGVNVPFRVDNAGVLQVH
jgi:hypothetical protein